MHPSNRGRRESAMRDAARKPQFGTKLKKATAAQVDGGGGGGHRTQVLSLLTFSARAATPRRPATRRTGAEAAPTRAPPRTEVVERRALRCRVAIVSVRELEKKKKVTEGKELGKKKFVCEQAFSLLRLLYFFSSSARKKALASSPCVSQCLSKTMAARPLSCASSRAATTASMRPTAVTRMRTPPAQKPKGLFASTSSSSSSSSSATPSLSLRCRGCAALPPGWVRHVAFLFPNLGEEEHRSIL